LDDVTGGSGAAVDGFALAGCVWLLLEEPPARLPPSFVKYCGMTGRLLDYSGHCSREPVRALEREQNRPLPTSTGNAANSNDLALFSPEYSGDEQI